MSHFFNAMSAIPAPFNMVVWIVLIGSMSSVVSVIVREVRKGIGHHQELNFKRQMIEQGYDPADVERVVSARLPERSTD